MAMTINSCAHEQLKAIARAICRVQINGGDPDQPAVRWNGTECEPQEFPAWHDFMDEARAARVAWLEAAAEWLPNTGAYAPAIIETWLRNQLEDRP